MNELPYRPNVCMLLFNREGRLFLGERAGSPGIWQFPQGGAEPGLSLEENVIRELEEELGIPPAHLRIARQLEATHQYDFDPPPGYAVGKWRGQRQNFFLVEFTGDDALINLHAHGEPELTAWRWCTPDEVRAMAEPRRLVGYEKALTEFETLLRNTSR